jgi:hypothetical protein
MGEWRYLFSGSEPRSCTNVIDPLHPPPPPDCLFGTNHHTHLIRSLFDPRPGVDAMLKSKLSPGSSVVQTLPKPLHCLSYQGFVFIILRNIAIKAIQTIEFDPEHYLNCNIYCHETVLFTLTHGSKTQMFNTATIIDRCWTQSNAISYNQNLKNNINIARVQVPMAWEGRNFLRNFRKNRPY